MNALFSSVNIKFYVAIWWQYAFFVLPRGSRRRRPYLYRKRAIHRSRPTYSYSLEEAQGSFREGRPPPPLKPSNSFMSRRERRKRITMSVWEQRTSQLRRHRQMSSREILFSNPSEEKEAHGRSLSLHCKAMQHTPSGSVKLLTDPLAPADTNQAVGSSADIALDKALPADNPEPPVSVLVPESLDPTNVALTDAVSVNIPEPPESDPVVDNTKLGVNHKPESRSPRLNGERQHRHVKKFRPPDNTDSGNPERGGYAGIRGRRMLHNCDHQNRVKNRGSSPGSEGKLASCLVVEEERKHLGKDEEKVTEPENSNGEVAKPQESRWDYDILNDKFVQWMNINWNNLQFWLFEKQKWAENLLEILSSGSARAVVSNSFSLDHMRIKVAIKGPIIINFNFLCLTLTKHKMSCSLFHTAEHL